MILIPLTFAYAIVRFQMLNIRFVVRRTFLYAATTAIVFGFYTLAIATAAKLFAGSRLSASPLFNFGFFLVAIPLFEFLRRRLQTPLDRLFFRDKLDYQTALLEMSETITGELDLGKIADYLTRQRRGDDAPGEGVALDARPRRVARAARAGATTGCRRRPPCGASCGRRASRRGSRSSPSTSPTRRARSFASAWSKRASGWSSLSSIGSG